MTTASVHVYHYTAIFGGLRCGNPNVTGERKPSSNPLKKGKSPKLGLVDLGIDSITLVESVTTWPGGSDPFSLAQNWQMPR